jgi:hypothetical protein
VSPVRRSSAPDGDGGRQDRLVFFREIERAGHFRVQFGCDLYVARSFSSSNPVGVGSSGEPYSFRMSCMTLTMN